MSDQAKYEEGALPGGTGGQSADLGEAPPGEPPVTASRAEQLEPPALLADILRAAAGRSGGLVGAAVEEFLGGKGELLEVVRSSLTGRKTTAKKKIAAFLEDKFKLSAEVALVLAGLLIKVAPAMGSLVDQTYGEEKKPARKKKAAKPAGKKDKARAKKTAPKKKKTTAKTNSKKAAKKKAAAKSAKPAATKKKK